MGQPAPLVRPTCMFRPLVNGPPVGHDRRAWRRECVECRGRGLVGLGQSCRSAGSARGRHRRLGDVVRRRLPAPACDPKATAPRPSSKPRSRRSGLSDTRASPAKLGHVDGFGTGMLLERLLVLPDQLPIRARTQARGCTPPSPTPGSSCVPLRYRARRRPAVHRPQWNGVAASSASASGAVRMPSKPGRS